MPEEDKIKTTEEAGSENLQIQAPIDERDEVKQAEERTRQLNEKAKADTEKPDDKETGA